MVRIIWTELALSDLKHIHDYISQDSKVYADQFIKRLISRVDQLESFPRSGRVVPEFSHDDLRELIEGNYRIVYKVHPDHVGIARIHHSAKQMPNL